MKLPKLAEYSTKGGPRDGLIRLECDSVLARQRGNPGYVTRDWLLWSSSCVNVAFVASWQHKKAMTLRGGLIKPGRTTGVG